MRTLILLSFILFSQFSFGQKLSKHTPYYDRDSIYISGYVQDELGKPIENVMVLLHSFYSKKYDVTWVEKDTFYTDTNGKFSVALNGGQFIGSLYFKKDCLLPTWVFVSKAFSRRIILESPVELFYRSLHMFDATKIGKSDLSLTIEQAMKKYKIILKQTELFMLPNSESMVRGLRFETADSSMILLTVDNYIDSTLDKVHILNKKVTGIGIAFLDGKKTLIGKGVEGFERKIRNEYFLEKRDLAEE